MKKKRRLLPVPRITVKKSVFLILGLLLTFPLLAQAANESVSLTVKRQTVVEIFRELEKQTSFKFMFHDEDLLRIGLKDIDVRNVSLTEALDECLRGSNVTYEITGRQIIFKRIAAQQPVAAYRQVTGTVVNVTGMPIAGVSVMVEGSGTGTSTDAAGGFTLRIPSTGKTVLSFSFLGYKGQRIELSDQTTLRVVLEEGVTKIDEVIITGYATIDKGSYVGSVFQVKADDIQIAGESTIDQMLQGVVPGMSVVNTSGKVGSSPRIRIRGTSTILGNQEPLWVVDKIAILANRGV